MGFEFKPWPKLPRLNREIVITEKIDGTNACVIIQEDENGFYVVGAQSRNRLITPEDDNAGFARWVEDNWLSLTDDLGLGYHYGEWWGSKIGRKYGQTDKSFSLFNVTRWKDVEFDTPQLGVVPVLYEGAYGDWAIDEALADLRRYGSQAAPGFMDPEGIVVYHVAANQMFKVTLKNDEAPKGLVA